MLQILFEIVHFFPSVRKNQKEKEIVTQTVTFVLDIIVDLRA